MSAEEFSAMTLRIFANDAERWARSCDVHDLMYGLDEAAEMLRKAADKIEQLSRERDELMEIVSADCENCKHCNECICDHEPFTSDCAVCSKKGECPCVDCSYIIGERNHFEWYGSGGDT